MVQASASLGMRDGLPAARGPNASYRGVVEEARAAGTALEVPQTRNR